MGYFVDNRKVRFEDLENSGIYSKELMEEIKVGNYHKLKEMLDIDTRKNRNFMEPLLYAVKNEKGTYAIYEYYHEKLQNDVALATDIIRREPELIENTPVSRDRDFILVVAEINPKVIQHMSQDLKEDSEFTGDLCNLQNKEVTKYAATECKMPEVIMQNEILADNKEFMLQYIIQNANGLEYTNEELRNDYEFMKEASKNSDVIDYVIKHIEEFGEDGLSATKDSLFELSTDEAISGFEEESKKVKEQMIQTESEDLEQLLKRDKQLQRHIRFFERIQSGEVDPVKAAKMIDKICKNLDEKYRTQIRQFLKLDEAILERQQNDVKINPENIEKISKGVTLDGIREETGIIRQVIEDTKETENNKNDGTIIERT